MKEASETYPGMKCDRRLLLLDLRLLKARRLNQVPSHHSSDGRHCVLPFFFLYVRLFLHLSIDI